MGGLDVAVAEAARRAGLDPAKARAIYIEKSPALPFQILDDLLMETMPAQSRDPWSGLVASSRGALLRAFDDAQAIASGPAIQIRCLECGRSEEHTSELQSLMRNSYAVFCLIKQKKETGHNSIYR